MIDQCPKSQADSQDPIVYDDTGQVVGIEIGSLVIMQNYGALEETRPKSTRAVDFEEKK